MALNPLLLTICENAKKIAEDEYYTTPWQQRVPIAFKDMVEDYTGWDGSLSFAQDQSNAMRDFGFFESKKLQSDGSTTDIHLVAHRRHEQIFFYIARCVSLVDHQDHYETIADRAPIAFNLSSLKTFQNSEHRIDISIPVWVAPNGPESALGPTLALMHLKDFFLESFKNVETCFVPETTLFGFSDVAVLPNGLLANVDPGHCYIKQGATEDDIQESVKQIHDYLKQQDVSALPDALQYFDAQGHLKTYEEGAQHLLSNNTPSPNQPQPPRR